MLGLLITLMVSCLAAAAFSGLARTALPGSSRATRLGISGLMGLGVPGLCMLALGPKNAMFLAGAIYLVAAVAGWKLRPSDPAKPEPCAPNGLEWLAFLPAFFAGLVGLVGALAPSLASDWDTIAYHLAVPKQWLADGALHPISYIHHSFFPATVDALFAWGLMWGGQQGAKAFTLAFFAFGCLSVYGLAFDRYGKQAALWAVATFATIPVAVWETGTGYIDVAHGLYAGLGAWLVFLGLERSGKGAVLLGGVMLGFAAGSKYTGLQGMIGLGAVLVVMMVLQRRARQSIVGVAALLAVLICAPWYVRNASVSGNPVYPFFYERFGGKWWNQKQADIYRFEQKTFGVPIDSAISVPHAILGLAYQPGRYINPGQKLEIVDGVPRGATGNELGAVGAPIVATLVIALAFWRRLSSDDNDAERPKTVEAATLAWIAFGLLMWAFLSQQSRYMLSFAPPLALMAGGLISAFIQNRSFRMLGLGLGGLIIVQGLWTGYLAKDRLMTTVRTRVAFGAEDPKEYLKAGLPSYEAYDYLNQIQAKRVALFDDVFGFYLDVPYFWASYGHTNEMDYENLRDADAFVAQLKKLGIDRLYVSLVFGDRAFVERWMGSMGYGQNPAPLSDQERTELMGNVEARWRVLLADAVSQRKIELEKAVRGGPIFRVLP